MKRHPHRNTKIVVGDRVHATTEIVPLGGGVTIPLGSAGKVEHVRGRLIAVVFDTFPAGREPSATDGLRVLVVQGQVRLVTPTVNPVDRSESPA